MSKHHYHRVHPRLRGARVSSHTALPVGSLSPAQILTAYGFKQNQYAAAAPVKLGIGSLGGGVVQQDIDNSVAAWGMLAPNLTVRTVGGAANDPVSDQASNVEIMLYLIPTMAFTWWWLTGQAADITICFGPNASGGMEAVTRDLVDAGCEVCSWSWGSAASGWDPTERSGMEKAFEYALTKNVLFCAASGDNSIDDGTSVPSADYPCSDSLVWAVGGTKLTVNDDGTRADRSPWGHSASLETRGAEAASTRPKRCRSGRRASCRQMPWVAGCRTRARRGPAERVADVRERELDGRRGHERELAVHGGAHRGRQGDGEGGGGGRNVPRRQRGLRGAVGRLQRHHRGQRRRPGDGGLGSGDGAGLSGG